MIINGPIYIILIPVGHTGDVDSVADLVLWTGAEDGAVLWLDHHHHVLVGVLGAERWGLSADLRIHGIVSVVARERNIFS